MKYRVYKEFKGFSVQKSRIGIIWKNGMFKTGTNEKARYDTVKEAQEDIDKLNQMGPVK